MTTTDEALRVQFQLLQEQQQKKLMRIKQRKDEQRAHTASVISSKSGNTMFGVSDNLDLKLSDRLQNKSYLSEELVDHLNEQIRELKDENGRVYKLLSERDFELRNLKKKYEEEKAALAATGGPVTNETAGTKIIELSKKIREMTAEFESEKTKYKQLTKKCHELQQQLNTNSDSTAVRSSTVSLKSSTEDKSDDPGEVKVLQDKLRQMESKMVDFRNSNSSLKQELRIAHKALAQEIGENVNIQSVLNATSNWRGRSQQIIQLQQKNEELKQEILKLQSIGETEDLESEMLGISKKKSALDKQKEQLKKIEKEKKDLQAKLVADKEALEEENFALKHKLDVSKTRNQVLSNEIKTLKKELPQLLQKNEHDNELIEALMKEQTSLRQQLDEAMRNQHNSKLETQCQINEIVAKQQHEGNVVEQLKKIVADKESKVKVLEGEIQQLKLAHVQKAQVSKLFSSNANTEHQLNHGVSPVPVQVQHLDSRPSTGFETVDLQYNVGLDSPPLESRQSNIAGPIMNPVDITAAQSGPPSRVPAWENTKPPSRGQSRVQSRNKRPPSGNRPSSAGKPAVDVHALEELQYQCQEYRTVAQVAEVERDKLMDLMKVLQTRLQETNIKAQECQRELVEQRRRNALLEKQIGKVNLGTARTGTGSARVFHSGKQALTASVSSLAIMKEDEDICNMSAEELLVNLEIQRDENEALKTALQSTLKAKAEDLKVYTETIEETKKVFLQALRQYKQTVHGT